MTYKELQAQLKTFKSQGLTTIALNAKKDVLEAEYDRIMNSMIKDAFATEYEPEIVEDEENVIVQEANVSTISELQDQLRIWTEQGLTTIALDSSELELRFEVARIMGAHFAIPEEEVIAKIEKNVFATEDTDNEIIPTGNEAMNEINEAIGIVIGVNENTDDRTNHHVLNEPPGKEFIEALSKLLIIFVSSIVKLWFTLNRISQLTVVLARSISKAQSDINKFAHWYISGFSLPSFV